MKLCLKAIVCLPLLFLAGHSFAAEEAPVVSPTDLSNFKLKLGVRAHYSLSDSTQKNAMSTFSQKALLGLHYKYKNLSAVFEGRAGSTGNTTSDGSAGQQYYTVQKANVGLEFVKSDAATLTFVMGRDRLNAPYVYGPDGISTLVGTYVDNASSAANEDGVSVKYAGKFDFGSLMGMIGYYDSVGITVQGAGSNPFSSATIGQGDNKFNSQPSTQSRALAVSAGSDVKVGTDVIEARALYVSVPKASIRVGNATTPTDYLARDETAFEMSLGYNYHNKDFKGGIWYQNLKLGRTQVGSPTLTDNSDVSYSDGVGDDSQNISTVGLGGTVSSKLWGATNFLSEGDYMTFGAAYQNEQGQMFTAGSTSGSLCSGATASTSTCLKPTINQYNVGVAYVQGAFSLELDYLALQANSKIYTGTSVAVDKEDANLVYLVGNISL